MSASHFKCYLVYYHAVTEYAVNMLFLLSFLLNIPQCCPGDLQNKISKFMTELKQRAYF